MKKDILDGILACQRENFGDVGLRKRFKYAEHNVDFNSICCNFGNGIMEKNEEITELLCRLAFVIPMIKWLLLDTVKS